MPIEVKPLFCPDVLGPYSEAFVLLTAAESRRAALTKWAGLLATDRADSWEQELLADIFRGILGYAKSDRMPQVDHLLARKAHQIDGKCTDSVLGGFGTGKEQIIVVLEGKGPRDRRDCPFAGRRMSTFKLQLSIAQTGRGKFGQCKNDQELKPDFGLPKCHAPEAGFLQFQYPTASYLLHLGLQCNGCKARKSQVPARTGDGRL